MPIVTDFGPDIHEYAELGKERSCRAPNGCPYGCAGGAIVGHGYYVRKPKGLGRGYVIRVKRWRCQACRRTFSSLPSFVLAFRHYLVEVIQAVLEGRLELGYSWLGTVQMCSDAGMPARRTIQRWCAAFEQCSGEWLGLIDQILAQQDSQSPWLDTTVRSGDRPPGSGGRALLQAALHLLAWGKTRWQELSGYGLNERLRFLWHWGNSMGLPRLA